MIQSSVVFLIDTNGIVRNNENDNGEIKSKDKYGGSASAEVDDSMETLPFQGDDGDKEQLTWIKDFVLMTLFKEANNGNDYDVGRVQWSFKFFDSTYPVDYRDGRSFLPFDYESFENFEKQLKLRMNPNEPDGRARNDISHIKYLSDAIKTITGSLAWTESQSTNHSRGYTGEDTTTIRNMVYAFFRVPRTERELNSFTDLQIINNSTKDFMNVLLPTAFSHQFHYKLKIQLNFVDMWTAPENSTSMSAFPTPQPSIIDYPRQLTRSLHYLGNGKLIPVPELSNLRIGPQTYGLLPYLTYLRSRLKQVSAVNENINIPSHIKHLAAANLKNSQKISPDFDNSSISRSLKSASILEASINSQNKVLRPFRMSFEHEQESLEYHKQALAEIKAMDRIREGERKRKRFEYESAEDNKLNYSKYERRRSRHFDDAESDSVEVDSQCERDQRLESWVNQGTFSAKRKKSLDVSSSAVPMSRPMNRSSHVFHEPAPKISSRGKKMLATVERQKMKVTAVENKRRSSEGIDMKRITQKQEKELSSMKHRLKMHLIGELDEEEDIIGLLRKFGNEIKKFSAIILQEDDPCIVALAQALVNCASQKFSTARLSDVRGKPCSVKELLEQILLTEFTHLNKMIISAHESSRDKVGNSSKIKMQKLLTFREAELQIVLRLEIAWCFGYPDEDPTQTLLMDIVRLLQIIAAYRTQPSIDHFINTVLLPTYRQSNRFLRNLYTKMNIPLPPELTMDGSPLPSSSRRDDDSSIISSTSSFNLCPEDSASQLHMHHHKRHRHSPPMPRNSRKTAAVSGNKAITDKKKAKRQIMVASSNPKFPAPSRYALDRSDPQKNPPVAAKVSPKRVRRNLFDVQKKDSKIQHKDSKTLIALSTSRLTKSPVFKSPRGKPPRSPSGFFRAARSQRKFTHNSYNSEPYFGSPSDNPEVLCPESPATPGFDKRSVSSRYAATVTPTGSNDQKRIIQESPEVTNNEFDNRPMARVASLSFYSTGNAAKKSRAWEKSETQLMAARIKESVDLRSRDLSLTLSDFEAIPRSPDTNSRPSLNGSINTPGTSLSICADSCADTSMSPMTSKPHSLHALTGPSPNLNNPNIEALIRSDFHLPHATLKVIQTEPKEVPSVANEPSPNNLQTPSKRVQFNLHDHLVNTPVSARRNSLGTPKSILKESHD